MPDDGGSARAEVAASSRPAEVHAQAAPSGVRSIGGRGSWDSFKTSNFRLWFISQGVSMVGYFAQIVAQSLLVLELTGSGAMLGLVNALQFLPSLTFGVWAGVLSDRVSKWRVMMITQAASALLAAVQGLLVLAGLITTPAVLLIALLAGTAWAFDQPSRRTIVTELVDDAAGANAVNLNGALNNCAKAVGPAAAGLLLALQGLGSCFVFNALTSVVGVVGLLMMDRTRMRSPRPLPRTRGQVAEGISYVRGNPLLLIPTITVGVVALTAYSWNVLLPLLATREHDASASLYTALVGATALGAIGGSIWLAGRPTPSLLFVCRWCGGLGAALLGLAASPTAPIAVAAAAVVGLTSTVFMNGSLSIVQLSAEPALRGRVMSLFGLVLLGGFGIGGLAAGWAAEAFGTRIALAFGGGTSLTAALVAPHAFRCVAPRRSPPRPGSPDPERDWANDAPTGWHAILKFRLRQPSERMAAEQKHTQKVVGPDET